MFEALIKMVEADKIHFTEKYDNKGYLNIMEVNQKLMNDSEQKIRAELDKMDLSIDEYENELDERLAMIDAAKTMLMNFQTLERIIL